MWLVFLHMFHKRDTIQYPEEKVKLPARWRGRIVLTRDPDMGERCVGCYLCAAACPEIAFHFRQPKMKTAEGILNFLESIFQDVFFAAIVKKLALPMRFN